MKLFGRYGPIWGTYLGQGWAIARKINYSNVLIAGTLIYASAEL